MLLLPQVAVNCAHAASFSYSRGGMAGPITTRSDGTVTVSPRNEADQSALVVICHGLGDSAEGFVDVAEVRRFFCGQVLRQFSVSFASARVPAHS